MQAALARIFRRRIVPRDDDLAPLRLAEQREIRDAAFRRNASMSRHALQVSVPPRDGGFVEQVRVVDVLDRETAVFQLVHLDLDLEIGLNVEAAATDLYAKSFRRRQVDELAAIRLDVEIERDLRIRHVRRIP